jgi:hypothetical protein
MTLSISYTVVPYWFNNLSGVGDNLRLANLVIGVHFVALLRSMGNGSRVAEWKWLLAL